MPFEKRSLVRMTGRSLQTLSILLATVVLLTSCSNGGDSHFPRLDFEAPVITLPGQATPTPSQAAERIFLRVSLPASKELIDAVAALHVGIETGALSVEAENEGAGIVGATVDLADLQRFAEGYRIERIEPPPTSEQVSSLKQMAASGTLPDIYLTDALPALVLEGLAMPLEKEPAMVAALRQGRYLPTAVASCRYEGHLQAIPYFASTPMLYYSIPLLQEAGVDPVTISDGLAFPDFVEILQIVSRPADKVFALYDASELLPFLPSTHDPGIGWATYSSSGFSFTSPAFKEAVSSLRSVVRSQWTMNHLTADQLKKNYEGQDTRITGMTAFWIDDSASISDWVQTVGPTFGVAPLPYLGNPTLPLRIRALVIGSQTVDSEAAIHFATFLSGDPDALRMQARFGFYPGMLPMIDDPDVWMECTRNGPFPEILSGLRRFSNSSFSDGVIAIDHWTDALTLSLGEHGLRLLQGQETLSAVAKDMDAAANAIVVPKPIQSAG